MSEPVGIEDADDLACRVTMANRALCPSEPECSAARSVAKEAVDADREQIAAWCDERAAAVKREAQAHTEQYRDIDPSRSPVTYSAKAERIARCEGQASAFEAAAAALRGAK